MIGAKKIAFIAASALLLTLLAGCKKEETTGEKVDAAKDKAADVLKK